MLRTILQVGLNAKHLSLWMAMMSPVLAWAYQDSPMLPKKSEGSIRIATFNVSLHRKKGGELVKDLLGNDPQAMLIAETIQTVGPDILLVNEIDYDDKQESAKLFRDRYLNVAKSIDGSAASKYLGVFTGPVNTGVPSGLDLNQNGKLGESDDCWGYGAYPGQYGLAVFSRFEIDASKARTFQKLLWSKVPDAKRPRKKDGTPFWSDDIWKQLYLSSKSHWDVPIDIHGKTIHLLASHPTPPVFDGDEDRNGCRNHDEIRFWVDYIRGGEGASYIQDDQGKSAQLGKDDIFVVCGDLNSDPLDGAGISAGIQSLLDLPRVQSKLVPESDGAEQASTAQAGANKSHRGKARQDTADFNDKSSGNLRCDFVLPSQGLEVVASGVFWPTIEQLSKLTTPEKATKLMSASDHHLVWVDVRIK